MIVNLPKFLNGTNTLFGVGSNTEMQNFYIIGANGSGKSRMGIYLEDSLKSNGYRVIRVAAQKVLSIPSESMNRSVEMIDQELQTNTNRLLNINQAVYNVNHVTTITNDFGQILSKLFSQKANRDSTFVEQILNSVSDNGIPSYHLTPIELILNVWKEIFPHRQIIFNDNRVSAGYTSPDTFSHYTYSANDMSDGERGALYLLAHAFSATPGSVIIFDEPESHLHRSILTKVWDKLEQYTQDKLIITITHDLDLVSSRNNSTKIWIKEYYGSDLWNWQIIGDSEGIPENLFLQVLGTRKKILFVESTEDGTDQLIFREVYKDHVVVPCGSCEKVIHMTKSLNSNSFWKANKAQGVLATGLIDRDLRTVTEIQSLKEDNIEVLKVAEIENLLALPDIVKIICYHQGIQDIDLAITEAERRIKVLLNNILPLLSFDALKQELSYDFKSIYSNKKDDFMKEFIDNFSKKDPAQRVKEIEETYRDNIVSSNLEEILMLFKNKGIIHEMNSIVGGSKYKDLVIRLISSSNKIGTEIIEALRKNLPII